MQPGTASEDLYTHASEMIPEHDLDQFKTDGFDQVRIEASRQNLLMDRRSTRRGHGDQQRRLLVAIASNAGRHLETGNTRHIDVAKHDLWHESQVEFQTSKTGMGNVDLVTEQGEQLSEQIRKIFIVVDDDDLT